MVAVLTLGAIVVMSNVSDAVAGERVTLVNATGETLWIGAVASDDGSRPLTGLPVLQPGESAAVSIPDGDQPNHWRGRFFARQRCTGEPGSTFHCLVGDCGVYADRCATTSEPVSLAEFNFDQGDSLAPWYNVSYVDALSLTITIDTPDHPRPNIAGSCAASDCTGGQLLAACPAALAVTDPENANRINCVNPDRDAETDYTAALGAFAPRAYLWSTNDKVAGNETMFNCADCTDFVITFHNGVSLSRRLADPDVSLSRRLADPDVSLSRRLADPAEPVVTPAVPSADVAGFELRGYADKCIDVPGGISADGAQLQLWDCNGMPGQRFTRGPNDSLAVLDKCMDVAWASQENGAKVQLAWCNGGPAQVWVIEGTFLRNPHSGKCVDVRDWNAANGAPLQIWDCNPAPQENQVWRAGSR
ncbi:thaumatin family protein [Rhizomonospora bruguierae]|uniref:thaumatin family protein n=1 Tax=Rhizomonospora bruguierae TaxID=1581705 RepID=UPI0020C08C6C|nr:thaumatin family protein [Micromonospora sp. NBRC 107566]